MNVLQPPVGTADDGHADDALDTLLRAYFRAETPRRWPASPRPTVAPVARFSRGTLRSRLALAASIAALIAGALALSGALKAPTLDTDPNGIGAVGKKHAAPR